MSLVVPFEEIFDDTGLLSKAGHWERVRLGDVVKILNGFPLKSTAFNKEKGFPIIRIRDLKYNKTETFYTEDFPREYLIANGDLLIGMDGDFICYEWSGGQAALNQRVCKLIPNEKYLLKKFLFYGINGYLKAIQDVTSSVTVKHLSSIDIGNIPFTLPPLPEQQRIVVKLDALFEKIESNKQRLEKIPKILKRFRQSVLAAAVSGKLTEDWRLKNKKVENANSLFENIQKAIDEKLEKETKQANVNGKRKPKDQRKNKKADFHETELDSLPETWEYFRLEDITYLVTDGTHHTPKYQENGFKFLSVKNVRPFKIRDEEIKYITEKEYREINSRCNPERGDILYTKVGATFGYACVNNLDYPFSIFVSLALIKPVYGLLNSKYLEAVMNSETVFKQARERISGIGTPDLHLIEIRDFKIPLCPVEEQDEIVKRLNSFFELADKLESRYAKAKAMLDKFPQSILAKAFRGELVSQNPNDEPASVLLERIRQEKEELATSKKVRRAKEYLIEERPLKIAAEKKVKYKKVK
ncbi:MAG: Type I restriction-modification system, specificity subunit S [Cytophagales bacterium]|jgi:type I restriction enzyme S subunit|nr:restriction endonuclease subunit S [Bacteroidota bacterium]WHZ09064.1 MAG: Type I restriction-modification system, specificity subunit S [Cytophagales bacterium]